MVSTPLQYRPALSRHSDEVKKSLLARTCRPRADGHGRRDKMQGQSRPKSEDTLAPYLAGIPRQSFSFPAIL